MTTTSEMPEMSSNSTTTLVKDSRRRPERKLSQQQAELMRQAGQDATLAHMLTMKRPLTVETYLAMNYPDGAPPMTAELWEEIPEVLREAALQDSLRPGT